MRSGRHPFPSRLLDSLITDTFIEGPRLLMRAEATGFAPHVDRYGNTAIVPSKFLGADVIKLLALTRLHFPTVLNILWFLHRQLQLTPLDHFARQNLRFS